MSSLSTRRRFLLRGIIGPCAILGFFVIFRSPFQYFYTGNADLKSVSYAKKTAGGDFLAKLPRFHGCNDRNLCVVSNVCVSNEDGILLFVNSDEDGQNKTSKQRNSMLYQQFAPLFQKPLDPWKAKILPQQEFYQFMENSTSNTIHYAHHALVAPCFRRFAGDYNPAHFLFGQGRIFAASTNFYNREGVPFDAIVRHQCPEIHHWEWGQLVNDMVLKYAEQTGTLLLGATNNKKNYSDIYMPFRGKRSAKKLETQPYLRTGDTLVCADKAYLFSPNQVGPYFVNNDPKVVKEWKTYVANTFPSLQTNKNNFHNNKPLSDMDPQECRSKARIVIWQRNAGTALRRFVNVDEVQALAQDFLAGNNTVTTGQYYSENATITSTNGSDNNISVPIVTVNASTSALEQIQLFNSFDIFITPHGSHLTNMMFTDGQAAFIEVAAVPYDFAPFDNGKSFAKHWILSYGHKPYDREDLLEPTLWDACLHGKRNKLNTPQCTIGTRVQYIQSDLVVNTTILRANLQEALDALCSNITTNT